MRFSRLASVTVVGLVAVLVAALWLNPAWSFDPPWLLPPLNLIFATVIPLAAALLAVRAYRTTGVMPVLALGAGMLAAGVGSGAVTAVLLNTNGANAALTMHNSSVLLAGIFQIAAAVGTVLAVPLGQRPSRQIAVAYLAVLASLALLLALILLGLTPAFFVAGQGPTSLRQVVLGSATLLFASAALIWWQISLQNRTVPFLRWYVLGLAVFAVGLAAVLSQSVVGGLASWAGRAAQYLGAIFILVAVVQATHGTSRQGQPESELGVSLFQSMLPYRQLVESTSDAVVALDRRGRVLYWNDAARGMFGYSSGEVFGKNLVDLIVPASEREASGADLERVLPPEPRAVAGGRLELTLVARDGHQLTADLAVYRSQDDRGVVVLAIQDVTERSRIERITRDQAALLELADDAIFVRNLESRVTYWNNGAVQLYGWSSEEALGRATHELLHTVFPVSREAVDQALLEAANWKGELRHTARDGRELIVASHQVLRRDAAGGPVAILEINRDVSAHRAAERERIRLGTAVEQSSDAVIVTDLTGTIENVNSAFTRISGYGADEAIGQNPRITKSGRQPAAFYEAMWRRLTRGEVWTGGLSNRRKDGELYEVEATISPIRSPDGEVNGYLGVQRDVTALTAARSVLASEFRERAAVSAALSRLQPRGSAEETAAAICDELGGLSGIDIAAIFTFQDPRRGLTLAVTGPEGLPVAPGRPLPAARAAYLYERASQGPWAEAWRARPEDGAYGGQLSDLGFKAIAYAPIRNGEGLLGLVLAGTSNATFASHLVDHLPIVGEFAATASALLAGQVEHGRRVDVVRARIRAIVATRAFHPVFQPVVELVSGRTVGHEALTRFDDGTRPDEVFADAQAVGLGLELEAACLAAAIRASDALSPDTWLSLNTSPDLILEPITLRMLINGQSRQIVLEITEHVAIADYAAVRAALTALGPTVSLAVDDAGAGFASLHHVVELSPRFLKLDISLVRNLNNDPTRQAMIAGLTHFAGRTGCIVIAEGIEEPAELAMLRELGVPLGQGYLLGRPEPLPSEPSAQRPRT